MDKWVILDYESFVDEDDFNVINITLKDDSNDEFKYLESVRSFLYGIRQSYPDSECVEKQASVDIPRQLCFINNQEVSSYSEFIKNIGYTDLLKEALLLSTQASMFPVTAKLFEQYHDHEEGVHVSDFTDDNPLTFRFWVLDKSKLKVEISKQFRVIKVDKHAEKKILKTLRVNIVLEVSDTENDVMYSVVNTYK